MGGAGEAEVAEIAVSTDGGQTSAEAEFLDLVQRYAWRRFLPKAWEAIAHRKEVRGYPIAVETVSLIYNKKLLEVPPPTALSELGAINGTVKKEHPGASAILWGLQKLLLLLGYSCEWRSLCLWEGWERFQREGYGAGSSGSRPGAL